MREKLQELVNIPEIEKPLAAELIDLSQKTEAIMSKYKPGEKIPFEEQRKRLAPMAARKQAIVAQIYKKVERNDLWRFRQQSG